MKTDDILNEVKKTLFSMKGVAILFGAMCVYFAYNLATSRVIPMAYGVGDAPAVGANFTDVLGVGGSLLMGGLSFLYSKFSSATPEIIQAIVAFTKNPSSAENQRRIAAAIVGYVTVVLNSHPDGVGAFIFALLTALTKSTEDVEVKNILNTAASSLATAQFKQV